jgi:hypothetical protein
MNSAHSDTSAAGKASGAWATSEGFIEQFPRLFGFGPEAGTPHEKNKMDGWGACPAPATAWQ